MSIYANSVYKRKMLRVDHSKLIFPKPAYMNQVAVVQSTNDNTNIHDNTTLYIHKQSKLYLSTKTHKMDLVTCKKWRHTRLTSCIRILVFSRYSRRLGFGQISPTFSNAEGEMWQCNVHTVGNLG